MVRKGQTSESSYSFLAATISTRATADCTGCPVPVLGSQLPARGTVRPNQEWDHKHGLCLAYHY
eukprot:2884830-Rhodomonas_salina.2